MTFEFQRELSNREWKALGLARTEGEKFDVVAGKARGVHLATLFKAFELLG